MCWDVKVFDNNLAGTNAADLEFDYASPSGAATRIPFGKGCFAPRQSASFQGDLELAWSSVSPVGYTLRAGCSAGPMGGALALLLLSLGAAGPLPVSPTSCDLYLDPSRMVACAPMTLDHLGNLSQAAVGPLAFLPAHPSLSGVEIYGQWTALTPSGFSYLFYSSNAIRTQIPWQWGSGQGPGVSTVYAAGAGAHTAATGTLLLQQGLVMNFGT